MYLYRKFIVLFVYFLYYSSFSVNERWVVQGFSCGNCCTSGSKADSKDDPPYGSSADLTSGGSTTDPNGTTPGGGSTVAGHGTTRAKSNPEGEGGTTPDGSIETSTRSGSPTSGGGGTGTRGRDSNGTSGGGSTGTGTGGPTDPSGGGSHGTSGGGHTGSGRPANQASSGGATATRTGSGTDETNNDSSNESTDSDENSNTNKKEINKDGFQIYVEGSETPNDQAKVEKKDINSSRSDYKFKDNAKCKVIKCNGAEIWKPGDHGCKENPTNISYTNERKITLNFAKGFITYEKSNDKWSNGLPSMDLLNSDSSGQDGGGGGTPPANESSGGGTNETSGGKTGTGGGDGSGGGTEGSKESSESSDGGTGTGGQGGGTGGGTGTGGPKDQHGTSGGGGTQHSSGGGSPTSGGQGGTTGTARVAESTNSGQYQLSNHTPIDLDLSKKVWNDLYLHSFLLGSDYYEPRVGNVFESVSEKDKLIWKATNSNELSYLVVRKDDHLKIYQLNHQVRMFKNINGKWAEDVKTIDDSLKKELDKFFSGKEEGSKEDDDDWKFEEDEMLFGEDPVESHKDSEKLNHFEDIPLIDNEDDSQSVDEFDLDDDYPTLPPPEPFNDVKERIKVPEVPKSSELSTFKTSASADEFLSVDKLTAMENQRLRDAVSHLESELFRLKHEYEEFRSKVLSVNDLLYRVVDVLTVH